MGRTGGRRREESRNLPDFPTSTQGNPWKGLEAKPLTHGFPCNPHFRNEQCFEADEPPSDTVFQALDIGSGFISAFLNSVTSDTLAWIIP